MNILVFTVTLLMLLAMMTYARIEMYTSFRVIQSQFEVYMAHSVENEANKQVKKLYVNTAMSVSNNGDKPPQQSEGQSKIGIRCFLTQGSNANDVKEKTILLRNLIDVLFKGVPFYNEMLEKRPSFVFEIIYQLKEAAIHVPQLSYPSELATLELRDDELHRVFVKMLQGNAEGQSSLLDYLTVEPQQKPKVRVYLASLNLLRAMMRTEQDVIDLKNLRESLFKQLTKGDIQLAEGVAELREETLKRLRGDFTESLLDFSISLTNPKDYRDPV